MVYPNMLYVNVNQLLADCGGKLTFDSACAQSVGGIDWLGPLIAADDSDHNENDDPKNEPSCWCTIGEECSY